MLVPSTTRGVVALLLLDELSGERAAAARHNLANQRAGLDHLTNRLRLTEESRFLLEFGDEEAIISLAVLRIWCERFAVDVGWNIVSLDGDPRASARLNLFRSDGVDTHGGPDRDGSIAITSDVPIAYHADADMVLGALRRHVPTLLDMPPGLKRVTVWLMLDENGRVEKTAVSLEPPARGRRTMGEVLLEPFPGESLRRFERAGPAMIPAGFVGPNAISVWWLQRRADVKPDPEHGVYQFDSLRLSPAFHPRGSREGTLPNLRSGRAYGEEEIPSGRAATRHSIRHPRNASCPGSSLTTMACWKAGSVRTCSIRWLQGR
jgi:hypothetical protein